MKRFHFPLKSVATVREAREARVREAFTAAVQAVVLAELHLTNLRSEKAELERVMLAERKEFFRAADQATFLQSHRRVVVREVAAVSGLTQAVQARELRRQEWMEARRDVRLIEKLKETAVREYREETEREAQRLLDDHTNASASRDAGVLA